VNYKQIPVNAPRVPMHSYSKAAAGQHIVGHLLSGVSEPVLVPAFEYWRNVDKTLGDKVESGVRAGQR
jgi:catalase